jgi:hypothetical protein
VIYDPQSVGARAYKLLADEFLQNNSVNEYRTGESVPDTTVMAGVN